MCRRMLLKYFILSFIFCLMFKSQACANGTMLNKELNGIWRGEGKVIVSFYKHKILGFELLIDLNGNVSGKIGDAGFRNGKIRRNNIIYRWMGNREYIIEGNLQNYLIANENIKRASIQIFLDHNEFFLIGGFHSSGSKCGGKETMIVSGTGIKLKK